MLTAFCMTATAPSLACLRQPSLADIDDALSKHTLSSPDWDKAMELRAKMAEFLAQRKYRDAAAVEAQIMDIVGLKLERTRGCGRWVPKEA
jgi:hypothetical protein